VVSLSLALVVNAAILVLAQRRGRRELAGRLQHRGMTVHFERRFNAASMSRSHNAGCRFECAGSSTVGASMLIGVGGRSSPGSNAPDGNGSLFK
jgi:hypothetical protein